LASNKENNREEKKGSWGYFFKMTALNLVVIIALAVALLTGVTYWLDTYTHHGERIDVPSLEGVMAEDAIRFLEEKGLQGEVLDSVYAKHRPGSVIEQLPSAGMPVKAGRKVYLTIEPMLPRKVAMCDVWDGGIENARHSLRDAGFVIDSLHLVPSDDNDLVLGVLVNGLEVARGDSFPEGTHVVLVVGAKDLPIEAENEEQEEAWTE